jgi:nucleotide-binding universal stress UspA family protein
MSSPPLPAQPLPPTYKVVVGVDYSEPSVQAMRAAFDIALHRDSQIFAIAVAEGWAPGRPAEVSTEMQENFRDEAQQTLEKWIAEQVNELEKTGVKLNRKRIAAAIDFGKPAEAILALAEDVQAELIVVGTHGRKGLERLVVGSVATEVLRGAHCAVLVAR